MSAIYYPFFRESFWKIKSIVIDGLNKSGPEHSGQCKLIKQELSLQLFPLLPLFIDSTPRQYHMNMRMKL